MRGCKRFFPAHARDAFSSKEQGYEARPIQFGLSGIVTNGAGQHAYILSSPGTPTVYWPDMYDWPRGQLIRELIKIRHTAGIKADSPISFPPRYSGLVAEVTGSEQLLLLALDSNFSSASVPAAFARATLPRNNEKIRIWQAKGVNVQLRCDSANTQPGESAYAVGSGMELGDWDPARAVRLTDVSRYPLWQGQVLLLENTHYEWKCIVRSESDPSQVKWQEGANRVFDTQRDTISTGSF